MHTISRALFSVYDKTGVVDFARALSELGVELISTGGTARSLREAGLPVQDVSDVTGFPEIMDGRVKTLHPKIHGGLLGRLDVNEHIVAMEEHGIGSIDILVSNLYPFEETVSKEGATDAEIIEQIDIGGPAMVRAAAKNFEHTAVIVNPERYDALLQELRDNGMTLSFETRRDLAAEAFRRIAAYDVAISDWFEQKSTTSAGRLDLRYGENPHQKATLIGGFTEIFRHLHGKELSYNNILDIDAAAKLALEFEEPTVVIVKHNNPCGVGTGETLSEAWHRAFATDQQAPFGGIVAMNRPLDREAAELLNDIFTEVLIAPEFPQDTFDLLQKKKNRRLIQVDYKALRESLDEPQVRSVAGGELIQDQDRTLFGEEGLKVVTKREPSPEEMKALTFAWIVAKHVKSNAIVYASSDRTLGIGAGQMSRVDSSRIAAVKAAEAQLSLKGSAVASDAFFPFADGLLAAVEAGATAVIQPGGSVRDDEVIAAADEHGIAMVFTGMRHFRH